MFHVSFESRGFCVIWLWSANSFAAILRRFHPLDCDRNSQLKHLKWRDVAQRFGTRPTFTIGTRFRAFWCSSSSKHLMMILWDPCGILVGFSWDSRGIHLEANCFSIERGKCWVWQLLQSLIAAILVYFPSSPSSPSLSSPSPSILLLLLLAPSIRYGEHAHKWQEQWRTRRGRRRGGGRATYANDKSFA